MRFGLGVLAAAGLIASCATAPQEASTTVASVADAAEKKICKSMPVTGSNMAQRTCLTQAEWNARAKKGQEDVDEFVRNREQIEAAAGIGN